MNSISQDLVRLRFLVAMLGQRSFARWWDCDFMTEVGIEALDFNFPRRPTLAAFTATSLAAKRLHDERIGRTGVTHLFRLQPDEEILVQRASAPELQSLEAMTEKDHLLQELLQMAGTAGGKTAEGPMQLGGIEETTSPQGIAAMASCYHRAFENGTRIFPYFAARTK